MFHLSVDHMKDIGFENNSISMVAGGLLAYSQDFSTHS